MSLIPAGVIDHIGIAVHDIDQSYEQYRELLGAELSGRDVVESQGVEVAFLQLPGATRLELVAPVDDDSAVARFLAGRGPGLHHICVLVEDIEAALAELRDAEVELIDERPRSGSLGSKIAFVHPKVLGGVLLELKEKATPSSAH